MHKKRIERVQSVLEKKNLKGMIFFNTRSIFYLVGYHHIPTERPIALVVPTDGDVGAFVPYLEENYVKDTVALVDDVFSYFEYPDLEHPMTLQQMLQEHQDIGATQDHY